MAKYAAEDECGILIAFSLEVAKGTQDMIKRAKKHSLEVYVVNGYTGEIIKGSI